MKLLNVGGNNKQIAIPDHFSGWDHILLDIDTGPEVDVVCDARNMLNLPEKEYDAVYSSHNLEHFYRHDLPSVLKGFVHVLKDDGFIQILVPNMKTLFERLVNSSMDIEDVMYDSPAGPIRAIDMIYGMESFIERCQNDFMCHKTGFTPKSLGNILFQNGFEHIFIGSGNFNIVAFVFKSKPTVEKMDSLKLKYPETA